MSKRYYSPLEMIKMATEHAYCADELLRVASYHEQVNDRSDNLLSVVVLFYMAFEMTLRAYLLHDSRAVNQPKTLSELLALNKQLVLSAQETELLKNLSRQFAFRRGIDYGLWVDRNELLIFCNEIANLYERMQEMMPIELQADYGE